MGVRQQIGNGQVMRATGKALTTALTGRSIKLFPPVAGTADQVVTLLGKGGEPMAHVQIAQPQQFGNRNLLRTCLLYTSDAADE